MREGTTNMIGVFAMRLFPTIPRVQRQQICVDKILQATKTYEYFCCKSQLNSDQDTAYLLYIGDYTVI